MKRKRTDKEISLYIMKDLYFNKIEELSEPLRKSAPGYKKYFLEEFGSEDLREVFYDPESDSYFIF